MHKSDKFKPWPLEWSPAHIQRFWDWLSSDPLLSQQYFSRMVGDAILDEIASYISLTGTVVDVGAGPGFLVDKLIERRINTIAVDTSPESVALLNERHKRAPYFQGAYVSTIDSIPLINAVADMAILIETVEHMDAHAFQSALGEAYRILKPGGIVVITTPNEENLQANQIMCPNCGCVFHKVQHVRSWSHQSLGDAMHDIGFERVMCAPVLFSPYARPLRQFHRLRLALRRAKLPHLMYIGRKQRSV